MSIKILFFGNLTDATGSGEMILETFSDTDELNKFLQNKFPGLDKLTYRIAVNTEMINENVILKDGDEVAFLPPFAGG